MMRWFGAKHRREEEEGEMRAVRSAEVAGAFKLAVEDLRDAAADLPETVREALQ